MKKLLFLLPLLFLVLVACKENKTEEILIGEVDRTSFEQKAYKEWFDAGYAEHELNIAELEKLEGQMDSVEFLVLLGTWCGDTQRELPAFFKIIDHIKFDPDKILMIALDREKKSPDERGKNLDVEFVPTFIVMKGGQELGRIVEEPMLSLEEDLVSILMNNEEGAL